MELIQLDPNIPTLKVDDITSPDFEKNYSKYGHGENAPCLLCGKPVKPGSQWVRMAVTLRIIPPDANIPRELDQGFFPVGSGCVRKHPELKPFLVYLDTNTWEWTRKSPG